MPWAQAFLDYLSSGAGAVVWRMRPIQHRAARSPWQSGTLDERRVTTPPRISGAAVTLSTWEAAGAQCTVGVALEGIERAAHYRLARGTLWEIVARYRPTSGAATAEEVVFRGVVDRVDVLGYVATVGLRDLTGVVRTRPDTDSDGGRLFALYDGWNNVSAVATSTWTVASTSMTLSTSVTTEGSGAGSGSTYYGVAYVEPLSGAPFYVYHRTGGSTSNSLSNGGGILPAAYGSIPVNAAVGSRVTTLPSIEGHPVSLAQRIVATGGAGSGDPWDGAGLPATWGAGIHAEWRDDASFSAARTIMEASPTTYAGAFVGAEQAYPLQYVAERLRPWGLWLVGSQGCVGIRVALDPQRQRPPGVFGLRRVRLEHVSAVNPHTVTPGDVAAQARFHRTYTGWPQTYGDSTQYAQGDGWPTASGAMRTGVSTVYTSTDLAEWIGPMRGASEADALDIAEEVATRLAAWTARVPVVYDVIGTLALAGLAPGDWVELDPRLPLWSRTTMGAPQVRAMVVSVAEDWAAGAVALRLAELPPDTAERP